MKNIEIENLNTFIGEKQILKNININFEQGQFIAIVGKNGNGKTSIFKSIMNHYNFSKQGKIKFDGVDITNLEPNEIANLGIWYLPQNSIEIKGLKILDFLKTILVEKKIYNSKTFFKQINELAIKLHLPEDIFNRDLNVGFSGGEKKKLELLQLMLVNPDLILIDEIDSGLDLETIKILIEVLNDFKKQKKTILMISHNQKLFDSLLIDRYIKVKKGLIEEVENFRI